MFYNLPKLNHDAFNSILANVMIDEFKQTIFSMNPYKALGPNGFKLSFFALTGRQLGKIRERW